MYLSYQILSLGYLFSGEGIWRDLLSQAYCNSNIEIEKVAPHMLSTYISPCATTFVPFPSASSLQSQPCHVVWNLSVFYSAPLVRDGFLLTKFLQLGLYACPAALGHLVHPVITSLIASWEWRIGWFLYLVSSMCRSLPLPTSMSQPCPEGTPFLPHRSLDHIIIFDQFTYSCCICVTLKSRCNLGMFGKPGANVDNAAR